MKKALTYTAGLIALYLLVHNYTGSGALITKGAGGGRTLITSLQGR